jgi:hypothetical protein
VIPDVLIAADTPSTDERAFEHALGKRVAEFRQVVGAYARSLRGTPGVSGPDFSVTPQMRSGLFEAMLSRGIVVDRRVYEAAAPGVSELLGYEATRALFGRRAESRRRLAADQAVGRAVSLVAGAATQRDVFARAERRN